MGANASYFGETANTSCAYPWANATTSLHFIWHLDSISSVHSAVRPHWMTQTLKSWHCHRASCLTTTRSLRNAVLPSAATHGDAPRDTPDPPTQAPTIDLNGPSNPPSTGEKEKAKAPTSEQPKTTGQPNVTDMGLPNTTTNTKRSFLMRRIGNQPMTWHSC